MMMSKEKATIWNNRKVNYIEVVIISDNEEMCYSCTNGVIDTFLSDLKDNFGTFEIVSMYIED